MQVTLTKRVGWKEEEDLGGSILVEEEDVAGSGGMGPAAYLNTGLGRGGK